MMFDMKFKDQRMAETNEIETILDGDIFCRYSYLKDALKEARICYCVDAYKASIIMSISFVEKLLKHRFPEEYRMREPLSAFLNRRGEDIFEGTTLNRDLSKFREIRNEYIHDLMEYVEIYYIWEGEAGETPSAKEAKRALDIAVVTFKLFYPE